MSHVCLACDLLRYRTVTNDDAILCEKHPFMWQQLMTVVNTRPSNTQGPPGMRNDNTEQRIANCDGGWQ